MKRRKFLKTTSTTMLWALAWSQYACNTTKNVGPIGLQLYTVRDDMNANPEGTLEQLRKIGYDHVESAGYNSGTYYGMEPKAFKKVLDDLGLKIYSGHNATGVTSPDVRGTLTNDWEMAVADAAAIDQKYMVIAYLHPEERQSLDDYKRLSDNLNKAGEICKKYGIQLAYHNHDFEFQSYDGQIAYDLMLAQTQADLLQLELDLYWIKKAKFDPITYFSEHSGRFPLWHVKDMDNTEEQFFTEVGNGVIDWEPIFQAQGKSGMQFFFVEQDQCRDHKPLESVAISHDYLTAMTY